MEATIGIYNSYHHNTQMTYYNKWGKQGGLRKQNATYTSFLQRHRAAVSAYKHLAPAWWVCMEWGRERDRGLHQLTPFSKTVLGRLGSVL